LSIVHPARGAGQDRVAIHELDGAVAIVVADGAGGTGDFGHFFLENYMCPQLR
jgi:hypothetical protein